MVLFVIFVWKDTGVLCFWKFMDRLIDNPWIYIVFSLPDSSAVLQIRDFQLVGQWAEGLKLKGIFRPQLVQESCIFLLPRSNKNGENQCWFILYHVYLRWSNGVKKSHWKTWGNSWPPLKNNKLKYFICKMYFFDNVSTFFLPEVHIKNMFRHQPTISFKPWTMLPTNSVFVSLLEAVFVLLEFCQ